MIRQWCALILIGIVAAGVASATPPALAEQGESAERRVSAASLAAGAGHTCALLTTGAVRCWGYGGNGVVGRGDTESIGDNETVASGGNVRLGRRATAIASGDNHACAVLVGGAVRCWGRGGSGQLGYRGIDSVGDDEPPHFLGNVLLGARATAITAGNSHTCALLTSGAVRCWGSGTYGQLGYGNTDHIGDDETPATAGNVPLGAKATAISAGGLHTCALLTTGAVRCWGQGSFGRLGYGNTIHIGDDETPATAGNVPLGAKATAISAGGAHTCALLTTGVVRCWGYGLHGQLGYATQSAVGDDETPAAAGNVKVGAKSIAITVGDSHTCATLASGAVRCWGYGTSGRLGYGGTDNIGDAETPADAGNVPLEARATAVSAGYDHTCALSATGAVRCWGSGTYGQLGLGNTDAIGDNEPARAAGTVPVGGKVRVTASTRTRVTATVLKDRRAASSYRVGGSVRPIRAVADHATCAGQVAVVAKAGNRVVARTSVRLGADCRFSTILKVSARKTGGRGRVIELTARYGGSGNLTASQATIRVHVGRGGVE